MSCNFDILPHNCKILSYKSDFFSHNWKFISQNSDFFLAIPKISLNLTILTFPHNCEFIITNLKLFLQLQMYIFQFWLFPSNSDFFPQNCEFKSQNSDFFSQLRVYLSVFASQLRVYISQFFLFLFSQLRVYISQFWLGNLQFFSFLCYCEFTSRNYYYQQGTHEQLSQHKKTVVDLPGINKDY